MMTTAQRMTGEEWLERRDLLLLEYACGALDEATALLMAAYVTLSPAARQTVARFETMGGTLMCQDCQPVRMSESSLRCVLDKLEKREHCAAGPCAAFENDLPLPLPLRSYMGASCAWKHFCPGIRTMTLQIPGHALLMHLQPGVRTPRREAREPELALVLNGGYHDGHSFYRTGDLVIHETTTPVLTADEQKGCLYFAVGGPPEKLSGFRRFWQSIFR